VKWLLNKLYEPKAYQERVLRTAEFLNRGAKARKYQTNEKLMPLRPVERECAPVLKKLPFMGISEARMAAKMIRLAVANRRMIPVVMYHMLAYRQIRYFFGRLGIWDRSLAKQESPWTNKAETTEVSTPAHVSIQQPAVDLKKAA
jgi:hypothetical protein